MGLICATVWVLAYDMWEKLEPRDPRKAFANDVLSTFRTRPIGTLMRETPRLFWKTVFKPQTSIRTSSD